MAVVNDGNKDIPITSDESEAKSPYPPQPEDHGVDNGAIFVSVPSYRDGERCGETLKALFENAKDPNRVFVGLVEQNDAQDAFCIEEYCKLYGIKTLERKKIRENTFKVVALKERQECPRIDQIHHVAFHHISAKGPMYARSMARKVLGDQEFCMQIDAHSDFAEGWDDVLITDWQDANNEFAVLSTLPPPKTEKEEKQPGGEKETEVPRQCRIKFRDNGFPDFAGLEEKSTARNLETPLLSLGYSAAFSFAKCHFEESVPYDPFSFFAMPVEQFSRYARLWTRGYDTYTPTSNVVFHDYEPQTNGHGQLEWFKRQRDRFRKMAIRRAKFITKNSSPEPTETELANMGIYGLGKRRTLEQLGEFTNLDFVAPKGNVGENVKCANLEWVPYDDSISPVANMYDKPDNLESQPEFPMRKNLIFYEQAETEDLNFEPDSAAEGGSVGSNLITHDVVQESSFLSGFTIFIFWLIGLVCWCTIFSGGSKTRKLRKVRRKVGLAKDA